jgi:hypothetical protein
MNDDQRVRYATDARSELGSTMPNEDGRTPAQASEDGSSEGRKSDGTSIRWEKVQARAGFGRNEFTSGSYGTFVESSRNSLNPAPRKLSSISLYYWKWIVLIVVLVIMGLFKWYGLGLGGEFVERILFC